MRAVLRSKSSLNDVGDPALTTEDANRFMDVDSFQIHITELGRPHCYLILAWTKVVLVFLGVGAISDTLPLSIYSTIQLRTCNGFRTSLTRTRVHSCTSVESTWTQTTSTKPLPPTSRQPPSEPRASKRSATPPRLSPHPPSRRDRLPCSHPTRRVEGRAVEVGFITRRSTFTGVVVAEQDLCRHWPALRVSWRRLRHLVGACWVDTGTPAT